MLCIVSPTIFKFGVSNTFGPKRCWITNALSVVLARQLSFSLKDICHQKCLNLPPLVLETRMLPQYQQETAEGQHSQIDSNSCFNDLSDFPN